jgi:hypothetical protein
VCRKSHRARGARTRICRGVPRRVSDVSQTGDRRIPHRSTREVDDRTTRNEPQANPPKQMLCLSILAASLDAALYAYETAAIASTTLVVALTYLGKPLRGAAPKYRVEEAPLRRNQIEETKGLRRALEIKKCVALPDNLCDRFGTSPGALLAENLAARLSHPSCLKARDMLPKETPLKPPASGCRNQFE